MSTGETAERDTSEITITLPSDLVRALDERLVNGEGNRGAVIRHLIEREIRAREDSDRREQDERELIEQFVRGWREQPQTEDEFGWLAHPKTLRHLDEVPWE